MSKRPGTMSDDERATIGAVHRRVTPARGIPFDEPVTGNYTGDDLAAMREQRPYNQRIAHLEVRLDDFQGKVDSRLNSLEVGVAKVSGQLDVLPELISVVRASAERADARADRAHASVVVVEQANALDKVDARKDRRKLWLAIVGLLSAGAGIGKLLHEIGIL